MNPVRWLIKQLIGPEEAPAPGPDDLVSVGTADGEAMAGLWQSRLQANDIPCLLKSVGAPPYSFGAQTFVVQVRFQDFIRARALLGLDNEDTNAGD